MVSSTRPVATTHLGPILSVRYPPSGIDTAAIAAWGSRSNPVSMAS